MLAPNGMIASPGELPRELPHNIEAEQALLGAILNDNTVMDRIADVVTAADFYEPLHGQIFEAIATRIGAGRLANPVSLADAFRSAPPITGELTVPIYIRRLMTAAVGTLHAIDYAKTIHDLAVRREIIRITTDAVIAASEAAVDVSSLSILEDIEGQLFQLAERGERNSGPVSIKTALASVMRQTDEAFRRGGGMRGLSTGLVDLDRRLGGLAPGGLYILAGRPSMGKTALATNIAWHVAKSGKPVHFVSLEMSYDELAYRIWAHESVTSSENLRRASNIDADRLQAAYEVGNRLPDYPLSIDDRCGKAIAQVAARARRNKRRKGTELIVVDYLQLMTGGGRRHENRVQELTEITVGLKALAKELSVPILALSQLSRDVEKRENKRPLLSDLRESGSIEQDADAVILLFREEYYVERQKPGEANGSAVADWQRQLLACAGKAEANIAKNRHGSVGTVDLQFDAELTLFSDLARSEGAP